ncbi:MAG: hypothetical protein ACI8QY_000782, partial [bacterium]
FTDNWVEMEAADDILDQMPVVKDPQAFRPLFSGKLYKGEERHLDQVGSIKVEPENFRIRISIAKEQAILAMEDKKSIARSTANHVSFSSRLRLTGNTDLTPSTSDQLGLTHTLALSRGLWNLEAGGNYVKHKGYDFGHMQIAHNVGSNVYSFGMLQADGVNFVSSESLYGFQLENNKHSKGDDFNNKASPVEIFIPSRGTVRIYRGENQLIYTQNHDFGLTRINTKRFPSGSYEIRIAITEDTGVVTEERRFFQKNNRLLGRNEHDFKISAGIQRNGLDLLTSPVYQFQYATRITDSIQFDTNILGVDSTFAIEPKLSVFFGNGYEYTTALTYTSENDLSFTGRINYAPLDRSNRLTWFASIQHVLMGHNQDYEALDEFDFAKNISQKSSTIQTNVAYRFDDINWSFNAQRTKKLKAVSTYSYGPSFDWILHRKNGHILTFKSNLNRTRTSTNHGLFLSYRYKPRSTDWDYNSTIGNLSSGATTTNQIKQAISYDNHKANSLGSSLNVANTSQFQSGENINASSLSASHDAKHVGMSVNYNNLAGSELISSETIGYTLDTTFMATQDDILNHEKRSTMFAPSSGGSKNNIIVKLSGNATGEDVIIKVNNIPKYYGKVGETIAFSIPEYSSGSLTISPSGEASALLNYDTSEVKFTIFPGNIAQHQWVVNKVFLLMGRAVDNQNKPIKWQRIEGLKDYTTTDSNGYFQMEVLGSETPYINTSKHQCVFALPPINKEEPFKQVGDISCG